MIAPIAALLPAGLTIPVPHWPLIGERAPVAILFTTHMVLAQFTAGCISIAPFAELYGIRRGHPHALHYAERLTTLYYLLFSLGASLGVFAVTALYGLWASQIGLLFNRLLPLMAFAFCLFVILIPLLVVYKNTFGRMSPRRHVTLGFAVAFWQNLFIVCIVGLDAFLITPEHPGFTGPLLDPAYTPLLLHRLVGNVSWAALLLGAVAVIRLMRVHEESERTYQAWAARTNLRIGLLAAVLMPWIGFALVEAFRQAQPGYFANLVQGSTAWLMVVQEALMLVVLVGGNLAIGLENSHDRTLDRAGRVAVVLSLVGMVLGLLPAQVLGSGAYWLRYVGLGFATVVTFVHILQRSLPARMMPSLAPAPGAAVALPYTTSALARRATVIVGVTAMFLSLYMGLIKEESRGQYTIYGELTQSQSRGNFIPGPSVYPR
jgi:hypothetical protein